MLGVFRQQLDLSVLQTSLQGDGGKACDTRGCHRMGVFWQGLVLRGCLQGDRSVLGARLSCSITVCSQTFIPTPQMPDGGEGNCSRCISIQEREKEPRLQFEQKEDWQGRGKGVDSPGCARLGSGWKGGRAVSAGGLVGTVHTGA